MKAQTRGILLIGMPGAGKSSVGAVLARKTGRKLIDSDALIGEQAGESVASIINTKGEEYFRGLEAQAIEAALKVEGAILALGGGAIQHQALLKRANAAICYIRRPLRQIAASLGEVTRPLSRNYADLERLYAARAPLYQSLCHFSVDNLGGQEDCAQEILALAAPHLKYRVAVIDGPNLNMLGIREPGVYGSGTLQNRRELLAAQARRLGVALIDRQSNYEGEIVEWIQQAHFTCDGIIINPAALTHYSYAVYDALLSANLPSIEVHISDIRAREGFRANSVTAPACQKQITGQGFAGYSLALDLLTKELLRDGE
jgi:3-dehydroquinate dehydratase-2